MGINLSSWQGSPGAAVPASPAEHDRFGAETPRAGMSTDRPIPAGAATLTPSPQEVNGARRHRLHVPGWSAARVGRRNAREVGPTLALAGPVIFAEVGWVAMGVVDTVIVGRLGAEALGAIGVGATLFLAVAVFGMGMLLGLDSLVSQACGAGRRDDCHRLLAQGVYLALAVAAVLTLVVLGCSPWLGIAGVHSGIVELTIPYARTVVWSLGPLLVFTAFRRYLQATGRVLVFVFVMITANLINVAAGCALIFGIRGIIPPLGVAGAGWAATVMYAYMAAVVVLYTAWIDRGSWPRRVPRPDLAVLCRLFHLGLPAAAQMALESGIFAVATMLAGRLDSASLAAHQVVQTVAGLTAMMSLGISTAATVRVGHAVGRRDPAGAAAAGRTAMALGIGFMSASGLLFLLFPVSILDFFTMDPAVVATGTVLLAFAAGFQVFDGLQAVATGALRGLGETRLPMVVSLLAHWVVGLPLGYYLAFHLRMGLPGLWAGMTVGLIVTGLTLSGVWRARMRSLSAWPQDATISSS